MIVLPWGAMAIARKENLKAGRRVRFPGIGRHARALGVSASHLWRVLAGERSSRSLAARYAALKEKGGPTKRRGAKGLAAYAHGAPGSSRPRKAGGEGAGSPVLRVNRPEAKHLQGAGVPSDTLPTGEGRKA
jgi:hypothetical protein